MTINRSSPRRWRRSTSATPCAGDRGQVTRGDERNAGGCGVKRKQRRQGPKNTLAEAVHHQSGIWSTRPPFREGPSTLLRHRAKAHAEDDGARVKASVRKHRARMLLRRVGKHRQATVEYHWGAHRLGHEDPFFARPRAPFFVNSAPKQRKFEGSIFENPINTRENAGFGRCFT